MQRLSSSFLNPKPRCGWVGEGSFMTWPNLPFLLWSLLTWCQVLSEPEVKVEEGQAGEMHSTFHPAPEEPSPCPAPQLWSHSHLQDRSPQRDEFCTYWALLDALCLSVWRWIWGPFSQRWACSCTGTFQRLPPAGHHPRRSNDLSPKHYPLDSVGGDNARS